MAVLVVALVLGGLTGLMTGGRWSNLSRVRFKAWPLLVAAFISQFLIGQLSVDLRWVAAAGACLAAGAWSFANRDRGSGWIGPSLLAIGSAVNCVVVAANRGMPVSAWALRQAGFGPHTDLARGFFYKHVFADAGTRLRAFGDVIPLRLLRTVVSPGDVLMLGGIALTVWAGTRCAGAGPRELDRETGASSFHEVPAKL